MKNILFLILVFTGVLSFSQKLDSIQQYKILATIDSMNLRTEQEAISDSCDKYLKYDWINVNFRAHLLAKKGLLLANSRNRKVCDSLRIIKDSLFKEAIEICTDCKIYFLQEKHNALHCDKRYYFFSRYEDSILKENGYKHSFITPVISPQYFYGNNQWIGVEVSLVNFLQPYFRVKDYCKGKKETYYEENMAALSFLSLGYRKNISQKKGWGMNFSFLSVSRHWINVRPLNVSYLSNGNTGTFGYSPEVGVQFWHLHLNAGYHLGFKKSMRDYEKVYFTAKFDIPFYWK